MSDKPENDNEVCYTAPDKIYHFYPVKAEEIKFRVKAPNDAHIALTTGPEVGDPMYEIFIGGWKNTISAVRKNRNRGTDKSEATPHILSANEYRDFRIRWDDGVLKVFKEKETKSFLEYKFPESFEFSHFGICTAWGASGEWCIEAKCCGAYGEWRTTPDKIYNFYPVTANQITFWVKAQQDAHIALTTGPEVGDPMYEIIIGDESNNKSVIRKNRAKDVNAKDTPKILSADEYRGFRIRWDDGVLTVFKENDPDYFLKYKFQEPFKFSHFGICTIFGVTGEWRIKGREVVDDLSKAIKGGEESFYVGQAYHKDDLLPGNVQLSHSACYVAGDDAAYAKTKYKVLCDLDYDAKWVPVKDGEFPENAIPGGKTERGEMLYVGRVDYKDAKIIGVVQRDGSRSVCYISDAGAKVPFSKYHILVGELNPKKIDDKKF